MSSAFLALILLLRCASSGYRRLPVRPRGVTSCGRLLRLHGGRRNVVGACDLLAGNEWRRTIRKHRATRPSSDVTKGVDRNPRSRATSPAAGVPGSIVDDEMPMPSTASRRECSPKCSRGKEDSGDQPVRSRSGASPGTRRWSRRSRSETAVSGCT